MAIRKLRHITTICRELYELHGASAVYDYCNDYMEKNPNSNVRYEQCPHCEAETPKWNGVCLICGQ